MGTIARSQKNPNTQNCQFEKDLVEYLKKGETYDESTMLTERQIIAKHTLNDDDIMNATEAANHLSKLMKDGNARQTAVKQWFKFKVPE